MKNIAAGDTSGHAVYVSSDRKRNTTAGEGITLNSSLSGSAGGWADPIPTTSLQAALTWLASNAAAGGNYTITISADETIPPQTLSYNGNTVGITLTGDSTERTVSLSSSGSLFTVSSGVTLTLGNNVTLQGRSDNTASLVRVNSEGRLVMESGSKITGNTANGSYGGGVFVESSGTFTMNGGEISGNTASNRGGGVYVDSGTFTMNGGEIGGNTASNSGGGVLVNGGTFTMNGGAISSNTASDGGGGGVYVNGGTFTKPWGGTIYGSDASDSLKNTATNDGHAVYVSSSKKRNRTAREGITLDTSVSGLSGGWE